MSIYPYTRSKERLLEYGFKGDERVSMQMRRLGIAANFVIVIILTLLCSCFKVSKCERDWCNTTTLYKVCNGAKHYETESPFALAVDKVLMDLISETQNNGFDYYSSFVYEGVSAYGHAACNGELTHDTCGTCVDYAFRWLNDDCGTSMGAQIQFPDCRLRYETYPFVE